MSREAVIVDTVRTPIGKRKGALAGWHPTDLLAFTLQDLLRRTGVDPERIDDVIGGCVTQVGEQGCNVTRNAWVAAGPAPERRGHERRPAVRLVAAGGALRRAGRDRRRLRPRRRVRCRVDDTSARWRRTRPGGTGPFSPAFLDACNGQLMTQFEVAQILADKFGISRDRDGRVRGAQPPTGRREHRERVLRPRDRAGARSRTPRATRPARCSPPTKASAPRARSRSSPRSRARPAGIPRSRRASPPATPRR